MKKKIFCMVLAIMLVVGFIPSGTASAVGSDSLSTEKNALDFSDRHVIVTLTHEASLNFKTYTPDSFPEVACVAVRDLMQNVDKMIEAKLYPERAESLLSFNKDIQYSEMYERLDPQKYTQTLCLELKEPGKANVLAAVKLLLERDDILFAEPNYYYYAEATPNDPYHTDQWALNNLGLYGAWNISTGSTDSDSDNWLRIGIIDTGIDDSHPDLTNRVDPNLSTSFASYSYDTDLYGHGTHVAGLIGALVNNEIGISGTLLECNAGITQN